MELIDRIFNIKSREEFTSIAIDVFRFQYNNCQIYKSFVDSLNWPEPKSITQIPFLPIEFFKTHKVIIQGHKPELIFKSSGTGGIRSNHFVTDTSLYKRSFEHTFRDLIGNPEEMLILALLPNYIEQGESSLIFMVNELIGMSSKQSGFILNDTSQIQQKLIFAAKNNLQVVIFGVAYALLDLCESKPDLKNVIIIETGGMKGRRAELTKEELHRILKTKLNCQRIFSEYGMTELLSQAYSLGDLTFRNNNWFKVLIRDTNDPFEFLPEGKTGGINIVDLANINSCSFIATQDLGKLSKEGFEVVGRFDNADIRGCNLLVQ